MAALARALTIASVLLAAGTAARAQDPAPPPPEPAPPAAPATPAEEPKRWLEVSGRVKFDTLYDFAGLQTSDAFTITNIDTSPDRDENNRVTADVKQSRVRLEAGARKTRVGDVRALIEGDFRGKGGTANYNFRIRQGYVVFAGLLVGQTRTLFGDADADPVVIDIDGPPTSIWLRVPQIRYSFGKDAGWRAGVSLEAPALDYTVAPEYDPEVTTTFLRRADLLASVRYGGRRGHVQVAAVYREIRYVREAPDGTGGETESETGGGVALSAHVGLGGRDRLLFQALYGKGIAHYLAAFEGGGWDAIPDGRGNLQATTDAGGYLGLEKHAGHFRGTALVGWALIHNDIFPGRPDFFRGLYASVTGFYDLTESLWVGAEYDYGRKEDYQGLSASANRLQLALQFSF